MSVIMKGSALWELVTQRCNSCLLNPCTLQSYYKMYIQDTHVGFVPSRIWHHLKPYTEVFQCHTSSSSLNIHMNPALNTFTKRTEAVRAVLLGLKEKQALTFLKGWRNEDYGVFGGGQFLLRMERSAISVLGAAHYGVHINGFTRLGTDGTLRMWIAKRSPTKATWPGFYDNMAAGGGNIDLGLQEGARKECGEEASIPDSLLDALKPVGTVSYMFEDDRGVFPRVEFCFDLELPPDFVPVNADGEAESFHLVTLPQVKEMIGKPNFKPNSGLVALDFLYRHGAMRPDEDPEYAALQQWMHVQLPFDHSPHLFNKFVQQ